MPAKKKSYPTTGYRDKPWHITKRMAENCRALINVQGLLRRLENCSAGKTEMDANQIKASLGLLNKALPDLQSVDTTITTEAPIDPVRLMARVRTLFEQNPELADRFGFKMVKPIAQLVSIDGVVSGSDSGGEPTDDTVLIESESEPDPTPSS